MSKEGSVTIKSEIYFFILQIFLQILTNLPFHYLKNQLFLVVIQHQKIKQVYMKKFQKYEKNFYPFLLLTYILSSFFLSGFSDPYVITKLLGVDVKKKLKNKTKIIKQNLNPVWNHELTFPVVDVKKQVLSFICMDWDMIGRDDFM